MAVIATFIHILAGIQRFICIIKSLHFQNKIQSRHNFNLSQKRHFLYGKSLALLKVIQKFTIISTLDCSSIILDRINDSHETSLIIWCSSIYFLQYSIKILLSFWITFPNENFYICEFCPEKKHFVPLVDNKKDISLYVMTRNRHRLRSFFPVRCNYV